MGEHIEDDPAPVFLAVVPGRSLRRLVVAFEHPVAELAAHAQNPTEEAVVDQLLQLADAGEEELVLHHAVLHVRALRRARQIEGLDRGRRERLLAVDVLAGGNRSPHVVDAGARERRVEVDRVRGVREAAIEIGRDTFDAVRTSDLAELRLTSPDEDRIGDHRPAAGQRYATLPADRDDRPDEMLIQPHASGDAVHDDADPHGLTPRGSRATAIAPVSAQPMSARKPFV